MTKIIYSINKLSVYNISPKFLPKLPPCSKEWLPQSAFLWNTI